VRAFLLNLTAHADRLGPDEIKSMLRNAVPEYHPQVNPLVNGTHVLDAGFTHVNGNGNGNGNGKPNGHHLELYEEANLAPDRIESVEASR
jgi:hypothetical protein